VRRPPGPFAPAWWRSPLRGPWLTSVLGSLLLVAMVIVAVTGFASHAAYEPELGHNAIVARGRDFQPLVFDWPTQPAWLYALNQGLHVIVGLAAVPLLLFKLWSVIPRLFAWPPVRSPAMAVERLALLALVGSAFFQLATGVVNVELWYPFHFDFVVAHYYGAWIFVSALVVHVAVKLPVVVRAYRDRGELRGGLPEPPDPDGLAPIAPDPPTLSRRGLFALAGGAMLSVAAVTAGQSIGGRLRRIAVLAPRGGGTRFPVNKTAAAVRVTQDMVGDAWRLELRGPRPASLARDALLALPLHTEDLPIACVEGWSTTQRWTGVRLADLGRLCGASTGALCLVESLQPKGRFRQVTLSAGQVADERTLLALRVNGADLPLDHGYPARMIIPAAPGVHCTKWVSRLTFAAT
jgi:DMSO/TMAO reductase YedYZ molybdopterin-dependent catalytic subunit